VRPRSIRLGTGLVLAGLAAEAASIVSTTPATFLLFVGLGIPAIVVGGLLAARGLRGGPAEGEHR
jgi:hypothetical protein